MNVFRLRTPKTARVITEGELNADAKYVWLAAHGYGMDVKRFAKWFEALPDGHTLVCPEALNRFYWGGLTGKPVATWMTSLERLHEIEDFCDWMDTVYAHIVKQAPQAKIICFGFSQGAATIMRWLETRQRNFYKIVLWSGTAPEDIDYEWSGFNKTKPIVYWGTKDKIVPWSKAENRFKELNLSFDFRFFEGGHRVLPGDLLALAQTL